MSRLSFAHSRTVHVRTAAFGLAAVVLLSGCQAASAPGGSPSETSSTTASPTSSASAPEASATPVAPPAVYKPADASGKAQNVPVPVMPELAKENSKAGLEAFIGYWYAVKNYANQTGELSVLSTLSSTGCQLCGHMQKAAVDSYRDGRWIAGGTLHLATVEMDWDADTSPHLSRAQVIQDAISYYNADGTEGRPSDAATNDTFVILAEFETAWKVVDTGVIR
ncbi:DUF6318 family protein [Paenarthrobacter aurescens]|uniref:DUF6318 domain-containing protein n=3 Tax=Paenarthrobacter TaxID=1742992 RepID=A0A4Y3NIH5_PAEAU|nr:DUF6318 family protein [Paenarthrobacter aurescens]MDO6145200.1 DUF6318 family protein [Paenarthrobacter aurescens]MDO6149045.1 DUF6318 family protein [Paenarthrobacter aurescens]MDO6160291.1 DUF6318 family protein [Paenarthrobacter aurescens]MDO6164150.1 DUF6318 family protein [Paenarthrobacter aurescens]GEB21033.1 hypothetical protein AAU01_37880 [Paenarthrobacter aurescens]